MSKVVHLSESAHARAKTYCQKRDLKMSEWVATLIDAATSPGAGPHDTRPAPHLAASVQAEQFVPAMASHANKPRAQQTVSKKKLPLDVVDPSRNVLEGAQAYAAPPFWARNDENAATAATETAQPL